MSKLDWEKRNKVERPKQKRRESQRTKILKAYENGTTRERDRILQQLEQVAIGQQKVLDFNSKRKDASGRQIVVATTYQLIALIKGDQK